jgi:ATP:ADP antiporter, AAA family
MIKGLLSILNVVEGEERPVLFILGYGFFMGIFLAAYKIVATTLFLNNLSEYIREAFFVSGMLGVFSTWFYSIIQNRVRFSKLVVFNIISIFVFIAVFRIIFLYNNSDLLIFILFVMLGPITSLLILGFWGVFGRMFDMRQSKRIIGGIDSGQLTAIIITTFSIPFIIPYIADLTDILIIGEVGLAISIVFFVGIFTNFKLISFHEKLREVRKLTMFRNIFKDKYIIYLSFFLFLSMAAFVFVDYSFMNVTEQQYPDEKQLASFLGVFEGSIMILSLLLQTFVNEKLLSMYGMKITLVILPLILFIFTGLAIFAGSVFGYSISNPEFIWFFLFIALSKLFVTTLREATENPVFKLFFMPLDSRIRFDIQTKIEGTVNEFSRAFTGGVILLLGFLPFFKLIHYSWILVFIIIGWIYMIFRLYHLYRENIRMKLERQKEEADKLEQKGRKLLVSRLFESIDGDNPNLMIFALRALSKIAPDIFKSKIDSIKNDHSIDLTNKVMQTLEGDFSFIHVANLKKISDVNLDSSKKEKTRNKSAFDEEISEMIKSHESAERKLAAELISATGSDESVPLLIELLNDTNTSVVNAAMKAASELKKTELLPFILDNLYKSKLKDMAIEALVNFGETSFQKLDSIFYNSEQNLDIKLDIVKIYGKVGGAEAQELLWSKVDFPDNKVVAQVFLALSHCGFRAMEVHVQRIKQVIEEDIASIVWNLKAIVKFKESESHEFDEIINSIREENDHIYGHIYMLLSMIYDQKSIELVKENIETKTTEGISYAVELLDVFLSEDLKQRIIPILDDIQDIDRIRRLQMFYPLMETTEDELLRQIITRGYNQINRWTKVSAIRYIGENKISGKYDMELISNLFNPDMLIKEISAWSMREIDSQFFIEHNERLESSERNHLRNLLLGQHFEYVSQLRPHMKTEIVSFMKKKTLLAGLPSYILASIVDFIEDVYLEGNTVVTPSDWSNESFYLLFHGSMTVIDLNGELMDHFTEGDFLGEQINIDLLEESVSFNIDEDTALLKIEKNKFFDLITNEYEVTLKLLDSFQRQTEKSSIQ